MADSSRSSSRYDGPPDDYPMIDGIPYFPGTTREFLAAIKQLQLQSHDVFVATYPKSGTTWISEILWQIYRRGTIDTRSIAERCLFLEYAPMYNAENMIDDMIDKHRSLPDPRFIKSHLPFYLMPDSIKCSKAKVIYVIRNPKDVAVSFYHHYRSFRRHSFEGTWHDYFEYFIRGKVDFGLWFDHVLGWWAHRDKLNILFLKYEDVKKDAASAIRQIAEFIGEDIPDETIQCIAQQTSFDSMKDMKQFSLEQFLLPDKEKFLRKGEVGDWRKYFTAEQSERMDKLYAEKMAGSGLELEF